MPLRSLVRDWGLEIVYMISGAFGGLLFVMKKNNRKRPTWEKILIIFIGVLTANYLTPLVVWLCGIPENVHNGIAFILGYAGLNTIGYIIDYLRNKVDKKK